jgi:hypothetical protein
MLRKMNTTIHSINLRENHKAQICLSVYFISLIAFPVVLSVIVQAINDYKTSDHIVLETLKISRDH